MVGSVLGHVRSAMTIPPTMNTAKIAIQTIAFGGRGESESAPGSGGRMTGIRFRLNETGNQTATAHRPIAVPRNGHTAVRHRLVAIDDEVGLDVRMLGTRHFVALAGNPATVKAHGLGCADDFAIVIGRIAQSNKIDHKYSPLLLCLKGTPNAQPYCRMAPKADASERLIWQKASFSTPPVHQNIENTALRAPLDLPASCSFL
ncbi:hypothetical protein BCEN4_370153 [Burkholderia cenocepacia]|nr:hypothetical protein BCEN4_370153 [Burkholderia cenocepacia]